MVVIPCSMRTLAGIANGYGEHLVHRAADVVLKERRKLCSWCARRRFRKCTSKTCSSSRAWASTMLPPMPAFYNHPQTVDDVVNHIVGRVLDQFGIPAPFEKRWDGHMHTAAKLATVGQRPVKSGT